MAERHLQIVRDSFAPAPPRPAEPVGETLRDPVGQPARQQVGEPVREQVGEPAREPINVPSGAPLEIVPPPASRSRLSRWLKWIFALLVCLWVLDATATVLIRYTALQKRLTARLSAAFGRPVEVDRYNFSLWTGPVLEAQSITVAEDPRFGNEYFVRADSLTIHLRWLSLIRGHLGLGTLSLSNPSLNVVRNSAGDWNLAEWLPRPNQPPPSTAPFSGTKAGAPSAKPTSAENPTPVTNANLSGTGSGAKPTSSPGASAPEANAASSSASPTSSPGTSYAGNPNSQGANYGAGTISSPGAAGAPRFERIEMDGGRINFKVADEKLPFAFINVAGTVNAEPGGRWRIDLVANPWRVATLTQQAGEVHVAGRVGGTSSRLLPATFDATWSGTSVSDALRLMRGDDFGIRGDLAVAISAQSTDGQWDMRTRAELRQVHRWNLALRPDNPDVNFLGQIRFDPRTSNFELTSGTLEAPHSNATVSGSFAWQDESAAGGAQRKIAEPRLEIVNSAIDLDDVLAWFRAFHAGVLDRIAIQGSASVAGSVSGWPPKVQSISLTSDGADLSGLGIRVPLHLQAVDLQYDPAHFSLAPVVVSLGARKSQPVGTFRIDTLYRPKVNRPPTVRIAGNAAHAGDLVYAAATLGWNLARGWAVDGPFRCDLRWQGTEPWRVDPVGTIELGGELGGASGPDGASLRAPFLNLPIEGIRTRAEVKPGSRHVVVSSADAFGAHWIGTFDWREPDRQWQFALSADHLATADLDRWLNPRWRETFIARMLPFLNSRSAVRATPDILRADGQINLEELAVGNLKLHDVQGELSVGGRNVELTDASARFYGGEVSGSVVANLTATPGYRAELNFSSVDIAGMTSASVPLKNLFGGTASGKVSFATQGATRADLLSSLECDGSASVADGEFRAVNLMDALEGNASGGSSLFSRAAGQFNCADGKVRLDDLSLAGADTAIAGAGVVDFGRNVNLRLRVSDTAGEPDGASSAPKSWYQLSGTLASPQIVRVPVVAKRGR